MGLKVTCGVPLGVQARLVGAAGCFCFHRRLGAKGYGSL